MLSTVLTNDKTFRCLTNNLHLYSTSMYVQREHFKNGESKRQRTWCQSGEINLFNTPLHTLKEGKHKDILT